MKRNLIRAAGLALSLIYAGAASAQSPNPTWPQTLVVGTASAGGVYHSYGEALARLLTRSLGVSVTARPTEGPGQNIQLLDANEIQIGFVTLGSALQGWNGTGSWNAGREYRSFSALFPMYNSPFQFAVKRDSPVKSLADLNGKRVGAGPVLGTAGVYVPDIMRALKVEPVLVNGEWAELAKQLADGRIDALAVAGGAPFPILSQLDKDGGLAFLSLSGEQIGALRLAMPELTSANVQAFMYPSLAKPYRTVGMYNFAVARADLPESLAYAIVDTVFANQSALADAQRAAAETIPSNYTRNTFMPFHKGAAQYYSSRSNSLVDKGD